VTARVCNDAVHVHADYTCIRQLCQQHKTRLCLWLQTAESWHGNFMFLCFLLFCFISL